MPFPSPRYLSAHGVLSPAFPSREPSQDERFVAVTRRAFPNIVTRQVLPPEAPPTAPHLVMASTSSQLAVSAAQADFDVRFYNEYVTDLALASEYVENKMAAVLEGYAAVAVTPSLVGVIATVQFSFKDGEFSPPAVHVMQNHLKPAFNENEIQDAQAKVALKVEDTFFVSLTVSNYESRSIERPVLPGIGLVRMRPWEGRLDDYGVQLSIDINNNLDARVNERDPEVTDDTVKTITRLLREVASSVGPEFAESGEVSISDLLSQLT